MLLFCLQRSYSKWLCRVEVATWSSRLGFACNRCWVKSVNGDQFCASAAVRQTSTRRRRAYSPMFNVRDPSTKKTTTTSMFVTFDATYHRRQHRFVLREARTISNSTARELSFRREQFRSKFESYGTSKGLQFGSAAVRQCYSILWIVSCM